MKRISTICAVFIGSMAFAQGPGNALKFAPKLDKRIVATENSQATPASVNSGNRAVFYTNDFSTPSDWTMTNTSSPSYDWIIGSTFPSGLSGQGYGPNFNSTSGGNFAMVDSDGEGSGSTQNANMTTTNPITACASEPTVAISFDNYHRRFYDTHNVQVSNDGVNFTTFEVNTNYGYAIGNYTTSPNAERLTVNISCVAANQAQVWIRFNYLGDYDWFWCVDDIELSDAPADDVRLTGPIFYNATLDLLAGAPIDYTIVPVSQIDDVYFKANLEEMGANDATNTALDIDVVNSATTSVFTGSSTAADFLACDPMRKDSVLWNHTNTPDTYTISYTANYDNIGNDFTPTNNVGSRTIKVVPNSGAGVQWARDNDTYAGGTNGGAGNPYITGNVFYVYNDITVYSIDAVFISGNNITDPGTVVSVTLYEMDPAAAAIEDVFVPVFSGSASGIDYTLNATHLSNASTTVWNKFPVNPSAPLTGVLLTAGKQYMAAIEGYGGPDALSVGVSGSTPNSDRSAWFYGDGGQGVDWYYTTTKLKIRLGLDNTASLMGVEEEMATNLSLSQNVPNPSNQTTTINYSLTESADVTFEVVDVTGKVIYTEKMGNKGAGLYSVNLNTADFAAGVYYYTMTAGADKITKKMMVTK